MGQRGPRCYCTANRDILCLTNSTDIMQRLRQDHFSQWSQRKYQRSGKERGSTNNDGGRGISCKG
jgi:hypothetical protein